MLSVPKTLARKHPSRWACRDGDIFRKSLIITMVGTGRFELPTPRTPSECSTRLSHVPTRSSRLGRAGFWGLTRVYTRRTPDVTTESVTTESHILRRGGHCLRCAPRGEGGGGG